ncbi:MAG: ATP-binding protein, partial [Clostridia bacterium]|nr:ATP-binding protein [Clostridia bacterium]
MPATPPGASTREPLRHPGNEELFRALSWSVEGVRVGWPLHVHVEGVRGTGKTTVVRAFQRRLPRIRR